MGSTDIEIIAGTYEEFLIGYKFTVKESEIVQSFAAHNHSGSIRSLCVSGHYVATGATDDRIIVYDLKSRKEHCMLTHHNASVNCLQFTNNHSHLLSGSSDGVLAIVRVGNWQVEKVWEKAHKGAAIIDIAVHASGKLALTLGADHTLRTWNLVKGREAYAINLNSKCKDAKSLEKIVWAEDGTRFILFGGKCTDVWSIAMGGTLKVIEHDEIVCSCIWLSENEILVGYEKGQLALVEIGDLTKKFCQAHAGRVKVLSLYNDWIVSGSSTGEMKVWNRQLQEVAKQDSGCRITCLGIVPLVKIKEEETLEEVQEITVKNTVMKKSSVIVEVDDDDSIEYDLPEVKIILKEETAPIEISEDQAPGSSKMKQDRNEDKLETATEEMELINKQLLKKKRRAEKRKIKKKKEQKQKSACVKDEAKQKTEVVMGTYTGCGRKRKVIINTDNCPKKERRRKPEEPIKTIPREDGIPVAGRILEHLEQRRKIMKERRQMDALIEDEIKQRNKNIKIMGSYFGCGRKRKEIVTTTVNQVELPKKERRRKLEKPIRKDPSVNIPPKFLTFKEWQTEKIKREKEEKRRLRKLKKMEISKDL